MNEGQIGHQLKVYPDFFEAIQGEKISHDTRKNDVNFKKGETVFLNEYNPATGYTGRVQERKITFTSIDGQKNGYILIEMERVNNG